ncbi:MAG: PKD domain-containing protein [Armatimonadetes bacterium]|nr:PKD domain-containing protein [Armatimonadota bacterium]
MTRVTVTCIFVFAFLTGLPVWAQQPEVPGIGLAYFDNAPPGKSAPDGIDASDWDWRPLAASRPNAISIASAPTLVMNRGYWDSVSTWTSRVTSGAPWSPSSLYLHGQGPSAVWRKYNRTFYYQLNGVPPPNPNLIPDEYGPVDYYSSRYAWSGTMPASELPDNWYLDPMKRQLVESAAAGLDLPGSWGTYSDIAGLYEGQGTVPGEVMGAGGVALYFVFLACEYWLVIEYDNMVKQLNQQAQLYASSRTPTQNDDYNIQHDYYSLYDPWLGRKIIVRRAVPNYTVPSGVAASIAPTRDCVGGFTIKSGKATAPVQNFESKSRTVTVNRQFTSATIPFQFSLNCESNTTEQSQIGGRFSIKVYYHDLTGAMKSQTFPVAGFAANQHVSPWEFVNQKDMMDEWTTTNSFDKSVTVKFTTNATTTLSIAWSGEVILRAEEFGANCFEKVALIVTAEAGKAASSEIATNRAVLSVQPSFARNIAEGGPWRIASIDEAVTFTADASYLPGNTQSVSYTWDFRDGTTATGQTVSHTFTKGGTYDVLLKADPTVSDQAPNADLFNNSDYGYSYDIARIVVPTPTGAATDSEDADTVMFSHVHTEPGDGCVTITWRTSTPMTSKVFWGDAPTGPYLPGQSGEVEDANNYTTTHSMTITGLQNGSYYHLFIGGKPPGDTDYIWEWANNQQVDHPVRIGITTGSGSRAQPPRPDVVCAWGTRVSATQTRFGAKLAEQGEARLRYRARPATTWRQTPWSASDMEHEWTVSTVEGKVYEFVIDTRDDPEQVIRTSRRYLYTTGEQPPATAAPVQFGVVQADDGQRIDFPHPFSSHPVIVTSAQRGGRAVAACAVDNSPDGFRISLRDVDDKPVKGAWLQYLAFVPMPGSPLRGGVARMSDGQMVNLPADMGGVPVIVCSAQRGGAAVLAAAVDNSATHFRLQLRSPQGRKVRKAWVQWAAVVTPAQVQSGDGSTTRIIGRVQQYANGQHISFSPALPALPAVIISSQRNGVPQAACSINNGKTGADISIVEHTGAGAGASWVQWLAIARR